MAGSNALAAFESNCDDVERLLEIHGRMGGSGPGRRHRLEVLNKSAIVLLTAFWEAYCEDVAAEGLEHVVNGARTWAALPKELQKRVAADLKADKHELAVWRLADAGWRGYLRGRLTDLQEERNWAVNTPKADNIDVLFLRAIGLKSISESWHWGGQRSEGARRKLDRFVELRGAVAHRGGAATSVIKNEVTDYYGLLERLVEKTDEAVRAFVEKSTGSSPWTLS